LFKLHTLLKITHLRVLNLKGFKNNRQHSNNTTYYKAIKIYKPPLLQDGEYLNIMSKLTMKYKIKLLEAVIKQIKENNHI